MIFSAFIFGLLVLPTQSFAQQINLKNHPLTPVSSPIQVGNGTVFQTIIIFNTKPVEDVGLAEYNKAVNFERVKSMILNATFSDKMLKDIISDVEKQHDILQTKGTNVTKYYTNGSMTLSYSNWWIQSYVTSRLDQDGLQTIASNMNPGTSLHVTIDPIDREMQRIISNYNLNYSQPQQQSISRNTTNFIASNLTRIQPSSSYPSILNTTVNNLTSIEVVRNNYTVVTNTSKVILTVPEFPFALLVFVVAIFSITFIQRQNTNNF
jgi:hypothetical protein